MYPVCLDIAGRTCIIIGGGSVACRKAEGLLAANATVKVISPVAVAKLHRLAAKGELEWLPRKYQSGDLQGALLVFATTDKPEIQAAVRLEAEQAGQLLNLADAPDACNFHVPASVRRGDLLISVSTNGKSPAVAAMIRKKLEQEYGTEYKYLLELMAAIRTQVMAGDEPLPEKKLLFESILNEDIVDWIKSDQLDILKNHLQKVLGASNVPEMMPGEK